MMYQNLHHNNVLSIINDIRTARDFIQRLNEQSMYR